jgi:hypothetical protein
LSEIIPAPVVEGDCQRIGLRRSGPIESTVNSAAPDEKGGTQVRQWFAQLIDFRSRAVELQAGQFGNRQHFRDDRADVFEVMQRGGRIGVACPAKHLIAENAEFIEQATGLTAGRRYEFFDDGLGFRLLAGLDLEIGINGDEIGGQAQVYCWVLL